MSVYKRRLVEIVDGSFRTHIFNNFVSFSTIIVIFLRTMVSWGG